MKPAPTASADGTEREGSTGISESSMLRIPKAAELLAAQLRRDILSGRIRAGQSLPSEAKLLAAVGVGRPALREAQRILESEGLLQVQRGARGGAMITLPDPAVASRAAGLWLQYNRATLHDVYDTRALLEAAAAERIAEAGRPDEIDNLRRTADQERDSLTDRENWFDASLQFHARLVEAAGLQTLNLLVQMLREITSRHISRQRSARTASDWASRAKLSTKSHIKLLGLMESAQGTAAKDFWNLHMARAGAMLFADHDQETVLDLFDAGNVAAENVATSERGSKAADVLADVLRRRIVHAELAEGTILPPEWQLAETLGVGRPALREALRILESEGLLMVERGARGGARIHSPKPSAASRPVGILLQLQGTTIEDVYETRMIIQSAAARTIAERGSTSAKAAFRAAAERGTALLDQPTAWSKHAVGFHSELIALSGLSTLSYLGGLVEDIVDRHWATSNVSPDARPEAAAPTLVHRLHMRLVSLVDAGDAGGAESMLRAHLEAVQQRLVSRGDHPAGLNLVD